VRSGIREGVKKGVKSMTELHKDVKEIDVDSLIPYPNNPKKHPEQQIDKIAGSIQEFGFTQPVVVDKNSQIIIGHGRVKAAKKLDMDKIPVIERSDLTKAEVKALRLADNRVAESDWEAESLAVELEEIDEVGGDLEATGFDEIEINGFIEEPDIDSFVEEDNSDDGVEESNSDENYVVCPNCGEEFEL